MFAPLSKLVVEFVEFVECVEKGTFYAQDKCSSWHEIQNPSDLLRNAPKIASDASGVHLYHRNKNKRSTVP